MTNIQDRLSAHYASACKQYSEDAVLGVFLYGSWNYGTNLPDSDVDTKCILIPDLYHLAIEPYEVRHLHIDDEVCECMTIQHMVANWKKQNINFLEILYTDYCIINHRFAAEWLKFRDRWREAIAHYDVKRAILSMGNQALHTYKQAPEDFKKQMNVIRIHRALLRLINNHDYWSCIHMTEDEARVMRKIRTDGADSSVLTQLAKELNEIIFEADLVAMGMNDKWKSDKAVVDEACEKFILLLIEKQITLNKSISICS